jgi:hypothetical protein
VGDDVDFSDPTSSLIVDDGSTDDISGGNNNDTAGDPDPNEDYTDPVDVETEVDNIDNLIPPTDPIV